VRLAPGALCVFLVIFALVGPLTAANGPGLSAALGEWRLLKNHVNELLGNDRVEDALGSLRSFEKRYKNEPFIHEIPRGYAPGDPSIITTDPVTG